MKWAQLAPCTERRSENKRAPKVPQFPQSAQKSPQKVPH
jgi:hypothetical protein